MRHTSGVRMEGAEIDLAVIKNVWGGVCEKVDTPAMTPTMRRAILYLELEKIIVINPSTKRYPNNRVSRRTQSKRFHSDSENERQFPRANDLNDRIH